MNAPLLSIGIPTYNRAACLRQCLESIVCQFGNAKVAEKVEIVISDNNSSDNTSEVVREFQAKYPNITYRKNSDNLGVDRNIVQVVEMSQGKYVWLLGDDDALFDDSLFYLISLLEQDAADYYILNCWGYNNSLTSKALNHPNISLTRNRHFTSLKEYVSAANFNRDLVGMFCGLSMQLFLREPWKSYSETGDYIGTNAIHLHILMSVMKERRFCIVAKPCVKVRADNIRWDVFQGLNTLQKRAELTQKTLLWILNEYGLSYSLIKLKSSFIWDLFLDWLRVVLRKYILKNQKSRDFLKKFLGKL